MVSTTASTNTSHDFLAKAQAATQRVVAVASAGVTQNATPTQALIVHELAQDRPTIHAAITSFLSLVAAYNLSFLASKRNPMTTMIRPSASVLLMRAGGVWRRSIHSSRTFSNHFCADGPLAANNNSPPTILSRLMASRQETTRPLRPSCYARRHQYHQAFPLFSTNNIHIRQFASQSRNAKRKGKVDPFKVLQVKRKTPYAQVKHIFLQIAMQHHPDTTSANTPKEQEASREIFIKARQAFEQIVEDPETGGICLREELEGYVPDEGHANLDDWFKQQTGHDMPFMDEETMKEVARMTESVGGGGMDRGLDRDGGMWELARMVTRAVNSGGDGKNLLRLEAGDIKDPKLNANLRAKRRRK